MVSTSRMENPLCQPTGVSNAETLSKHKLILSMLLCQNINWFLECYHIKWTSNACTHTACTCSCDNTFWKRNISMFVLCDTNIQHSLIGTKANTIHNKLVPQSWNKATLNCQDPICFHYCFDGMKGISAKSNW